MKPDEFEQQLERQPLRPVPTEWRAEILDTARRSRPSLSTSAPARRPTIPGWREWLWPCPQAWAGLAALWLILLAVRLAPIGASGPVIAQGPDSPDRQMALAAQRREMIRLLDGSEPAPAPKPTAPGPRTDLPAPSKA